MAMQVQTINFSPAYTFPKLIGIKFCLSGSPEKNLIHCLTEVIMLSSF